MTTAESARRIEKSQWLRTWQVDPTTFYVESEDGKIAYKCGFSDNGEYCTCADFITRSKNDPNFKCKHLMSVLNCIPRDEVMEARFLDRKKPKLDERYIKTIEGKDFVLYAGLLEMAHTYKNLISIEVELLQYPSEENQYTCICKATAKTSTGGVFVDIGDANPKNCNIKIVKHLIRLSATRSKSRALRDLCCIGLTALEELGDYSEVIGEEANLDNSEQMKKDNVRKFAGRQTKTANEKPAIESDAGNMKHQNPVKPITAQELPKKPDDYPKESGQVNAVHAKVNNPIQPATDKSAEDKPASARQTAKPNNGNGKNKTDIKVPVMSEAQKSAIMNLSRRRNISVSELESLAMKSFNMPLENLSSTDASQFIRTLQTAA